MSSDTLRSGYFYKEGGGFKTWKNRFFVLTRDALSYYTNESKNGLKGTISRKSVTKVETGSHSKRQNILFVSGKDAQQKSRTYVFSFKNPSERESWMESLREWAGLSGEGEKGEKKNKGGEGSSSAPPPPPSSPPPLENIRDEKLADQYKKALRNGETERALELRDELNRRGLPVPSDSEAGEETDKKKKKGGDDKDGSKIEVSDRHQVSPDCDIFRIVHPEGKMSLAPGDLITIEHPLYINKQGKTVSLKQAYAPISVSDSFFDILVKRYPENHPEGPASRYAHLWAPGSKVFLGGSKHVVDPESNLGKPVVLVAMGAGIAPIFAILNDLLGKTEERIILVFANRTEADIVLKQNLMDLCQHHSNFSLELVLSHPSEQEGGHQHTGHINKDLLAPLVSEVAKDARFIVSGSKKFGKAVKEDVVSLGAKEENVVVY